MQGSLRIGCVKYLNARPLIRGWPGAVVLDHPAALCRSLSAGNLDLALVSSFEFLRNPIYQIVDNVSIGSDGPVFSVAVAYIGEMAEVEEIELDPAAETSVNLLRCLLSESELNPRFTKKSNTAPSRTRARLLIGDQAIQFRLEHESEFKFWDLGEQWKRIFRLPFVYALWLVRPEVANGKEIAKQLRSVRDRNLRDLDRLITEQNDPEFCARYYHEHLRFSFGADEQTGLRLFATLCEREGLIPKREIKFDLI